ncbi:type VII secretion-associated serine protease mycosin [Streptomyces sp. HNM0574]|uniref:type VII secretion-associated serine protease mycosin n=1 Tax=Streptomyces sp. HNM0574 TaxID=2714954 RepID=UPI00146DB935|nr:type VII secretion-associated serine protease mycosin [Streptomyces sp. HNM0574]NLU69617.1 type VII secretion-associated serine protease mycosin [Streptomyces sp. HNM0574]
MGITRTLRVISGAALTGALVFTSAPHATADQTRDDQWALKTLEAESIWKTTKGRGQTVAVIDDGVNASHRDLEGNVLKGKDFIDGGSAAPEQGQEHGTGMAAIIAGHGHGPGNQDGVIGLAPEAKILPIRDQGERQDGYAASIRYAVDQGASVINISQKQPAPLNEEAEQEAIAYALKRDVVIFAGSGNDGGPVGYPAAYPGVVAVTGTDKNGKFWEKSNTGKEALLSGPGVDIVTAGGPSDLNGYRIAEGTSDSTAYASAAAALLRTKFPDLSAGQIVNRLTKTAEVPTALQGAKLPDEQYGYGMIRPLAALQEDIPKGTKWGPLSVPEPIKGEKASQEELKERQEMQAESDRQAVILWIITGVLGLLFIGAIVLTIVLVRRRKRKKADAQAPYGYPNQPGQAPGYGMPPHQQGPPQHTAPPQQPPRN